MYNIQIDWVAIARDRNIIAYVYRAFFTIQIKSVI